MKIVFNADKMSIRTRNSDNAMIVSFETGEYEKDKIADLLKILSDTIYKVTVEAE